MRLLVDGDILVYRCGFAAENVQYYVYDARDADDEGAPPIGGPFDSAAERNEWYIENEIEKDDVVVVSERTAEPVEHALANVKSVIMNIKDQLQSDDIMIALSSGECFRHHLATIKKYKGNRDGMPRPVHYDKIREYLTNVWGALTFNAVEADDVLALCQNDKSCIVSIDKDLLQVPGRHYNWVRDERLAVTPDIGLQKLYMQVLTGDSTDNIPGIRGIGDVKARSIITAEEPVKATLADVCLRHWVKYLNSELGFKDGFVYREGTVEYLPWNSDTVAEVTPFDIAYEVFKLVRVGGDDAKEAASAAGEEIPYA